MFVGLELGASHGFLPTLDSVENHILQAKLNFCRKFVSWWSLLLFVTRCLWVVNNLGQQPGYASKSKPA